MPVFFTGKSQIRTVDWGATHLWDIKFDDAPNPDKPDSFAKWFPATEVEENVFTLETKPMEFYMSTYEIPATTTLFDLKITFLDDVYLTLQDWFTYWVNVTILNDGNYISPLKECCKKVHVLKLNHRKEMVKSSSYWVFPKGGMHFTGNSDSEPVTRQVEFVIAGTINHKYWSVNRNDTINTSPVISPRFGRSSSAIRESNTRPDRIVDRFFGRYKGLYNEGRNLYGSGRDLYDKYRV